MKNLLFFISILFILSFYSSCKKNKAETVLIPQEFKDYTVFPEGSWWVYKEIHTGEKDSSYVFFDTTGIGWDEKRGYNAEGSQQLIIRRNDTINKIIGSQDRFTHIYREISSMNTQVTTYVLFNPIDSIGQQAPIQGGVIIQDKTPTLSVQNQLYQDIIVTSFKGVVSENPVNNMGWHIHTATFARSVGMVRIQYFDGTIWELVDYHISD